jgi:leucyl aminopeptidase
MAKARQKTSAKSVSLKTDLQVPSSFLKTAKLKGAVSGKKVARVFILGEGQKALAEKLIRRWAGSWQKESLAKSKRDVMHAVGPAGPVWIFSRTPRKGPVSHGGSFEETAYSWHRDQIGQTLSMLKAYQVDSLAVEFHSAESEARRGALVGLEMAAYTYRGTREGKEFEAQPKLFISQKNGGKTVEMEKSLLTAAMLEGTSVNLARHLVNTPANELNPQAYGDFVENYFSGVAGVTVDVWSEKKMHDENMRLHWAVGQGAEHAPRLVHIRYRPRNADLKIKPLAFVGKGITFDSGGLDLKPSSGMRWMKKDMGGSACVMGVASWVTRSGLLAPCDFYLALAENSVDAKSFRPGDVIEARNGLKVEIHNTDAEGRLVLADALDVATSATGKDEPEMVINAATLTGACRVAVGAEIGGLFSNHDPLAEAIHAAGAVAGDFNWRLPLFSKYALSFSTPFGDLVNATDGFGGAITAALFLEKFVRQKPWAHLDIYAWADKAGGALSAMGGNGQAVQCLIQFLKAKAK